MPTPSTQALSLSLVSGPSTEICTSSPLSELSVGSRVHRRSTFIVAEVSELPPAFSTVAVWVYSPSVP